MARPRINKAVRIVCPTEIIYMDILGYNRRADEEAQKTGRPVEDIRSSYILSIDTRLNHLQQQGIIAFYGRPDYSDAWLVFTDSIWNAFKIIGETLKAQLPLAIAIGSGKFHQSCLADRSNETVSFLKTNIIPEYIKFYKSRYRKSPHDTFVLLTPEAYRELDYKDMCCKPYTAAKFYLLKQDQFRRELAMLEFLEKINLYRVEYRRIGKLYVKPNSYEKIKKILDEWHTVLLIGDPEMGKTYTAIKLLLDLYEKEGYEPIFIREEERMKQWQLIRERKNLKGKAIYLEDPWGKVEFRSSESLFREIGDFLREVKRKNCRVIVSSREKVFKEFEEKKETAEHLSRYVSELSVALAYDRRKLINMLGRYIDVFNPLWHKNEHMRKIAFQFAEEELSTPMSIKQFIDYTLDAEDEENLIAGGVMAAEETKIAFAREIKEIFNKGLYDRLVFLSFPYIGTNLEVAKPCYQDILRYLKDSGYDLIKAKDFDNLVEQYSKKVETSVVFETGSIFKYMTYIHPSYEEAFGSALVANGRPSDISKKIFSPVLLLLSENSETAGQVALAIVEHFAEIPDEVASELLFKISEKGWLSSDVASAVAENFEKLPESVRNELLVNLSENEEATIEVAWAIAENFDKLPKRVRNLLFKLYEKDKAVRGAALEIAYKFDKLPESLRNEWLLKLYERDRSAANAAFDVAYNLHELPEDVRNPLFKLAENHPGIAWIIAKDFEELPEDVRNELLFELAEKDRTVKNIASVLNKNFDKLPKDMRNWLDIHIRNTYII